MAFCDKCGSSLPDGATFCGSCGSRVSAGVTPKPLTPPHPFTAASDWDGGVLETIAASLVASFLTTITCGIATPWAVCYLYKFILSHTIIDGRRLRFDGTGTSLFGNWLVWLLLTVVTCGIYGFWVVPKMYKWIANHTHME